MNISALATYVSHFRVHVFELAMHVIKQRFAYLVGGVLATSNSPFFHKFQLLPLLLKYPFNHHRPLSKWLHTIVDDHVRPSDPCRYRDIVLSYVAAKSVVTSWHLGDGAVYLKPDRFVIQCSHARQIDYP